MGVLASRGGSLLVLRSLVYLRSVSSINDPVPLGGAQLSDSSVVRTVSF